MTTVSAECCLALDGALCHPPCWPCSTYSGVCLDTAIRPEATGVNVKLKPRIKYIDVLVCNRVEYPLPRMQEHPAWPISACPWPRLQPHPRQIPASRIPQLPFWPISIPYRPYRTGTSTPSPTWRYRGLSRISIGASLPPFVIRPPSHTQHALFSSSVSSSSASFSFFFFSSRLVSLFRPFHISRPSCSLDCCGPFIASVRSVRFYFFSPLKC